jgi:hypothetical protein
MKTNSSKRSFDSDFSRDLKRYFSAVPLARHRFFARRSVLLCGIFPALRLLSARIGKDLCLLSSGAIPSGL